MNKFLYFYQHIPYHLNPTALSVGSFSISWYSLMYLAGFFAVYLLLNYRIKKGEADLSCHSRENGNPVSKFSVPTLDSRLRGNDKENNFILNLLLYVFIGLLIGARLGFVLFYNLPHYLQNPLAIISPFDLETGKFIGIYGMSYHGGLIGIILASLIFVKKYKLNFLKLSNFVIPAIPAGYFFGRLGNFFNSELYGKITDTFWGMYFPLSLEAQNFTTPQLRHPSQLYEAFLEGLLIFLILWPLRNNPKLKNKFLGLYLSLYAAARIIAEFFRQPDEQIGYIWNFFSLGQILSFFMLIFGLILIFMVKYKEIKITSTDENSPKIH